MADNLRSYKPVPTEYRGTVYRSKSEAIFRACLDYAGWDVEYEPPTPLHKWDFFVSRSDYCRTCRHHLYRRVYIEYKPSSPTATYVNNLISKVRPWAEHQRQLVRHPESYIVWGSPFAEPEIAIRLDGSPFVCYPIFADDPWHEKFGWGEFNPLADHGTEELYSLRHNQSLILGITREHLAKAMRHRFDLA